MYHRRIAALLPLLPLARALALCALACLLLLPGVDSCFAASGDAAKFASRRQEMEARLDQTRMAYKRAPEEDSSRIELATMLMSISSFRADPAAGDRDLLEACGMLFPLTEGNAPSDSAHLWLTLGNSAATLMRRHPGQKEHYGRAMLVLERLRAAPFAASMGPQRGLLCAALAAHTDDAAKRASLFNEAYAALRGEESKACALLYAGALTDEARLSPDPAPQRQRYAEAEEQFRRTAGMKDETLPAALVDDQWALMLLYRVNSGPKESERENFLEQAAQKAKLPYTKAALAASRGDAAACVAILREGMVQDPGLKRRIAADPLFAPVRNGKEFKELVGEENAP